MSLWYVLCFVGWVVSGQANPNRYPDYLNSIEEWRAIRDTKRIRREVRDISNSAWDRLTSALNVMKSTPTEEGKALYGDSYRSYDHFVCVHVRTVSTSIGDQGHDGPYFFTWHSSFLLAFENVLNLIDPMIGGMPYIDWTRDTLAGIDLADSDLFSRRYFGSLISTREEGFAIVDGPFRDWPVNNKYSSEEQCISEFPIPLHNAYGYLRKRTNQNPSPFVTRMGPNICGETRECGDIDTAVACQASMRDIESFRDCMNGVFHTSHHQCIGGSQPMFVGQEENRARICRGHINGGLTDPVSGFRINAHDPQWGCFECPDWCALDEDPINCVCTPTGTSCEMGAAGTYDMTGLDESLFWLAGDFSEPNSSPNDVVFMFVHSNVDRFLTEWKVMNNDLAPLYGWPEPDHPFYGLNSFQYPQSEWMGLYFDFFGHDGPYTYRQCLRAQDVLDAPYIYDTVLDMIRPN